MGARQRLLNERNEREAGVERGHREDGEKRHRTPSPGEDALDGKAAGRPEQHGQRQTIACGDEEEHDGEREGR